MMSLTLTVRLLYLWIFSPKRYGVWGFGELWIFPANQPGKSKNLWIIKKYGLSEVWVMRDSTVHPKSWSSENFQGLAF